MTAIFIFPPRPKFPPRRPKFPLGEISPGWEPLFYEVKRQCWRCLLKRGVSLVKKSQLARAYANDAGHVRRDGRSVHSCVALKSACFVATVGRTTFERCLFPSLLFPFAYQPISQHGMFADRPIDGGIEWQLPNYRSGSIHSVSSSRLCLSSSVILKKPSRTFLIMYELKYI